MRILVLASDVPATTSMPGSPRLFSLCKTLSISHSLVLATGSESDERLTTFLADPALAGVFQNMIVLPAPCKPRWWEQQIHRIRQEVHFVTRYRNRKHHAAICALVRDLCIENEINAIYADGVGMAQYVQDASVDCPAIIDLHDCLSLLYSRMSQTEDRLIRKLALFFETKSVERCERSLSRTFDLIVTNSEVDEAYLKGLDASASTLTVGNGVDCDYFQPQADRKPDMSRLLFTGVMNYGPNEDAVKYFCDAIFPLVQKEIPGVEFWIVGKDPTEEVLSLGTRAGVKVTGGVPDMRPYLDSCGVFVSPIRYGAGIKNKILAALAMECAVVASPTSIEGLNLKDRIQLLTAEKPEEYVDRIISLIRSPNWARELGERGRTNVRSEYSWDASGGELQRRFETIVAQR